MESQNKRYVQFRHIATVLLGGITGFLIVLPFGLSQSPGLTPWYVLLGFALGTFAGYRRRNSRFFFYFCLAAIIMLSCLLTLASQPEVPVQIGNQ
jgi:hypothetical protein